MSRNESQALSAGFNTQTKVAKRSSTFLKYYLLCLRQNLVSQYKIIQ